MDDDISDGGVLLGHRAIRRTAAARHRGGPRCQRGQGVGAALRFGAGIGRAHRGRQLVQAPVESHAIRCPNVTPDLGHPAMQRRDADVATIFGSRATRTAGGSNFWIQ